MEPNDPAMDWLANSYAGMSRRQFLARSAAAGADLMGFAVAAKPVAGEVVQTSAEGLWTSAVTVPAGDFAIPAYVARPEGAGRHPVVLVLPEVFGLHEHIRDVTRRFAQKGYFAVTFEPYAREGGVSHLPDQPAVMKVANSVPDERVMADLDALVHYAKAQPNAHPDLLGVTGFCRGGMYTLLYAAHNGKDVKAAVAWYGQLKPAKAPGVRSEGPLDVAAKIRVPVLGLYGGADLGIPVADVKEMEATLGAAGTPQKFIVYPEAPHAFFADYRPSYRAHAAADAWDKCLLWFAKYLKT